MGDCKTVIEQLRTLAKEPENREYILSDRTCFHGLIRFLDHTEPDVLMGALEVLQLLCGNGASATNTNETTANIVNTNRQQMANDMELMSRLKKLMIDFSLSSTAKKLAGNTYATLQKYTTADKVPMNTNNENNNVASCRQSLGGSQQPLRDTTNTAPSVGTGSGLSFFSANHTSNARTYTFYIKSLNSDTSRTHIEALLLNVKGVVSFSLDVKSHRAIIRTSYSSSDLLSGLKSVGIKDASLFPLDAESNTNNENEPQYLPEPTQSSWFSSIVTWGSADPKKNQSKQQQQQQQQGGFMSRLGKSLNVF